MWLILFLSAALASPIPQSAWRAIEQTFQQAHHGDQRAAQLNTACKDGFKAACKWRRQLSGLTLEQRYAKVKPEKMCKRKPWACVLAGWKHSQRAEFPGQSWPKMNNLEQAHSYFSQACEAGEPRGCVELAKLELKGHGTKTAATTAIQRIEKACRAGDLEGCTMLGIVELLGMGAQASAMLARGHFTDACAAEYGPACAQMSKLESGALATDLRKRACELKAVEGCVLLAKELKVAEHDTAQKLFRQSCDHGNAEGCDQLGMMLLEGDKPKGKSASKLFEKSCRGEHPFGCYNQAKQLEDGLGIEKNQAQAVALYSRACVLGSGFSCFTYGLRQEAGEGLPADALAALQSYGRACELGSTEGCVNGGIAAEKLNRTEESVRLYTQGCERAEAGACALLANLYQTGAGVTADLTRARELYQQACKMGDGRSCQQANRMQGSIDELLQRCDRSDAQACYAAANRYEDGTLAIQNNEKALLFATKACSFGLAKGCVKQGYYLLKGVATNPNPAVARQLFQSACEGGELLGCHSLGLLFAEGRGVDQNTETAMRLLGQSCDRQLAISCGAVATIARGQKKPELAMTYAKKGCQGGDINSCATEAFLYSNAPYTDKGKAAFLFGQACERNHAKSCFNYAVLLYQGDGVPRDEVRSRMVMQRACSLGEQPACRAIGR